MDKTQILTLSGYFIVLRNIYKILNFPCKDVPCKEAPCKEVPCKDVPCKEVPCKEVHCKEVPCKAVPCKEVPCKPRQYNFTNNDNIIYLLDQNSLSEVYIFLDLNFLKMEINFLKNSTILHFETLNCNNKTNNKEILVTNNTKNYFLIDIELDTCIRIRCDKRYYYYIRNDFFEMQGSPNSWGFSFKITKDRIIKVPL